MRARAMLHHWRAVRSAFRSQRGALLAEAALVAAVFGLLGTAVLTSMQTAQISRRTFEAQSLAENIIRNQIAYIEEQPYLVPGGPDEYFLITPPSGYSLDTAILDFSATSTSDLSRIRITVYQGATEVKVIEMVRAEE